MADSGSVPRWKNFEKFVNKMLVKELPKSFPVSLIQKNGVNMELSSRLNVIYTKLIKARFQNFGSKKNSESRRKTLLAKPFPLKSSTTLFINPP